MPGDYYRLTKKEVKQRCMKTLWRRGIQVCEAGINKKGYSPLLVPDFFVYVAKGDWRAIFIEGRCHNRSCDQDKLLMDRVIYPVKTYEDCISLVMSWKPMINNT